MKIKGKPRVGVDVDGVLADLLTPLFDHFNAMFDTAYGVSHMSAWDITDLVPKGREEEFWQSFGRDFRVHDRLQAYPEAVDGMRLLGEVAEVYVITTYLRSAPTWVHDRDKWIMERFGIGKKRMVHTAAKHVFSGAALVDDKPQNVEEWQAEHEGLGVLWRQPYNEVVKLGDNIHYDARTWEEVVSMITSIRW